MDHATRLIIYNQLEILKHLNPDNAAHYKRQQAVVESGYTSRYDEVFGAVTANEASTSMQDEVWETLSMFRALHNAKQQGWTPSDPARAKFEGFDANNDDHFYFASHLIDDCGLFVESAPNKNSHNNGAISRFRRMMRVWNASADKSNLTPVEAEAIIKA